MDANTINKHVRQSLVSRGMKGIIPMRTARAILSKLKEDINNTSGYNKHDIEVDLPAIHSIANEVSCDCNKIRITVKSKNLPMKSLYNKI